MTWRVFSGLARWWRFVVAVWWGPVPEIRSRRTPPPSRFQPKDQNR